MAPVLRHVLDLLRRPEMDDQSDTLLLRRFQCHREEEAFAELVRRHGPMVLSVCRRWLRDAHAAEDVFQAVFLILARRAATIRQPASLAGWLFRVAWRLSREAHSR